jgi:hypothetical protein
LKGTGLLLPERSLPKLGSISVKSCLIYELKIMLEESEKRSPEIDQRSLKDDVRKNDFF